MIRRSGALALLALALAFAAQSAIAAPTTVNVRVEGIHKTLFEENVKTTGHRVNGHDGTGSHKCDGTNNHAHKKPGPTETGAFDTAMRISKHDWAGKWFASFHDFEITRVGPDSSTSTKFWTLILNWKDIPVGGCQQRIHKHDHVLIAYDAFGKPLLKLTGPKHATAGKAFTVKVVNGRDGEPVKGARVRGHKTNAKGKVSLKLGAGLARLKARKHGTIRSNELDVVVRP